MKQNIHSELFNFLAEPAVNEFFKNFTASFKISCKKEITENLSSRLFFIFLSSFQTYIMEELSKKGLLLKFIRDGKSCTSQIEEIKINLKNQLETNTKAFLKSISPLLYSKIQECIRFYISHISEVLHHLEEKKSCIENHFFDGKTFSKILRFSSDLGDSHNYGKTTVIIKTDAGKIVYKPHDLKIDDAAFTLTQKYFSDVTRLPEVVCGSDFGFCQFIPTKTITTGEEAKTYYEKLGGLCAVFCVLGSSDFHGENILCDGKFPVPIDLEMMISPEIKLNSGFESQFYEELKDSVLASCLMPRLLGKMECSFLFNVDKTNASAPKINGKKVNVTAFKNEFLKGFKKIYNRCIKNREEIIKDLELFNDATIRILVRSTNPYYVLIRKINEKNWLNDSEVGKKVLKTLEDTFEKNGISEQSVIAKTETESILRGDVPYFCTKAQSHDLLNAQDFCLKDYFEKNCIEHITEILNRMTPSKLEMECKIFEASFRKYLRKPEKKSVISTKVQRHEEISLTKESCIKYAEKIFRMLEEDSILTPDGNLLFFTAEENGSTRMKTADFALYNGMSGIGIFCAAIYRFSKDLNIRQKALEFVRKTISQLKKNISSLEQRPVLHERELNLSFTNGEAGLLKSLRLIEEYTGIEECFDLCKKILSLIPKIDLSFAETDLISGISGLVKVLCMDEKLLNLKGSKETVTKLCELLLKKRKIEYKGHILWKTTEKDWLISGEGHGQIGIASALRIAGQVLNRKDYIAESESGYFFECDCYSEKLKGWPDYRSSKEPDLCMRGWCSGGAGIGTGILSVHPEIKNLSEFTDEEKLILMRVIKEAESMKLLPKDHLCCGNCARIDFLIEAGTKLSKPALIQKAEKLLSKITERAGNELHFNTLGKDYEWLFAPEFFQGMSGIGYEFLRLAEPERVKSVLI